ncbi:hypothetical protein EDF51_11125 [Curtobacterium sp. PhB25]|uniref:hypothetical protein n=1 Tax=Curtobacterium sp. PhB25 TaxID=2485205 RepID=UPI0010667F91|nr:hypothetical protein [Curtobacterium sp. PhB25]TDW64755.1 hypothetical protein EDF51_11125 [Curtobacterium sp. PhB25]
MPSTISSDTISHEYTYAWLGTAGKSASTLTRDSIEVRRNCDTNPGFEVDASGWSASGATTTTYAWTGTANQSPSTASVNGAVKRTNYAHMGNLRAYNNTKINADTGGWHSATFVNGTISDPIRWDLNTYAIATNSAIAASVVVFNPNAFPVTVVLDVGDGSPVTTVVQSGSSATVKTWYNPNADGTFQFVDLASTTGNATVYFNQAIIEANVQATGAFFDGSTQSTSQGMDVVRSVAVSHSGLASLQVRWQSPSRQGGFAAHTVLGLVDDTDYMVSMWVSIPKRLSKAVLLSVTDSATQGPNAVTLQEATVGWQRIVFPYRTPVGSTGLSIWLYDPNSYTGSYLAQSVYIDDVLVETGSAELPYFDGSTPSYVEFESTLPLVVNGWEEAATGGNLVNPVVGGGFDVTLQAASLRQGAFELVYEDETDAAEAFAMHCRPSTFTISDTDRASAAMTYVIPQGGRISRALDDQTREYWIVRVEYQEV